MKTSNLKTILSLVIFIVSQNSNSQSLYIKGKFLDNELMNVSANYTLVCDKKITETGTGNEIEAGLYLDKNYTLIISKDSGLKEIISFSTYTAIKNNFQFDFEVILKDIRNTKIMSKNLFVYFDSKRSAFDYGRIRISKD